MKPYNKYSRHRRKQPRSSYNPYNCCVPRNCFNTYATISGECAHVYFNVPANVRLADALDEETIKGIASTRSWPQKIESRPYIKTEPQPQPVETKPWYRRKGTKIIVRAGIIIGGIVYFVFK